MLLLLVLGLVIVVPQLDCLAWPFLNPPGEEDEDGIIGLEDAAPTPPVLIDSGVPGPPGEISPPFRREEGACSSM